jgi:hypothetical protein
MYKIHDVEVSNPSGRLLWGHSSGSHAGTFEIYVREGGY